MVVFFLWEGGLLFCVSGDFFRGQNSRVHTEIVDATSEKVGIDGTTKANVAPKKRYTHDWLRTCWRPIHVEPKLLLAT